jgi:hypothetical protein
MKSAAEIDEGVISHLRATIQSLVGKRCVVYGGGLSRPLVLISLSREAGVLIADSENVFDGTRATMAGTGVSVADKDQSTTSVGLQEHPNFDTECGGKVSRVKTHSKRAIGPLCSHGKGSSRFGTRVIGVINEGYSFNNPFPVNIHERR